MEHERNIYLKNLALVHFAWTSTSIFMWVHVWDGVRVVNLDQKNQELISIFLFFPYYATLGQVFTTKLLSIKDQHRTAEGSPSDDDSYLGYSVATGEFNGDGDNADVIVGMPRGANLNGKVGWCHRC